MLHNIHLSFLSDRAIMESTSTSIILKPLDYYEKQLDQPKRQLSKYCLSYINDLDWNDVIPHSFNLILDGWVIYKDNPTDFGIGSDEWSLKWLKDRFEVTDLCSRSLYNSQR